MKKSGNVVTARLRIIDGQAVEVEDYVSMTLPPIEYAVETMKGTGIVGEIEVPTTGHSGPMTLTIVAKSCKEVLALLTPGVHKVEGVWMRDEFNTANVRIGQTHNKIIVTGFTKTFDEGGVDLGSGADTTVTMTCNTYARYLDGRTVIDIDKLNGKFEVNRVDLMAEINAKMR